MVRRHHADGSRSARLPSPLAFPGRPSTRRCARLQPLGWPGGSCGRAGPAAGTRSRPMSHFCWQSQGRQSTLGDAAMPCRDRSAVRHQGPPPQPGARAVQKNLPSRGKHGRPMLSIFRSSCGPPCAEADPEAGPNLGVLRREGLTAWCRSLTAARDRDAPLADRPCHLSRRPAAAKRVNAPDRQHHSHHHCERSDTVWGHWYANVAREGDKIAAAPSNESGATGIALFCCWARHQPGLRTARYDEIGLVTCRRRCRCYDRFGRLAVLNRVVTPAFDRSSRTRRKTEPARTGNSEAARSLSAAPSSLDLVGKHRLKRPLGVRMPQAQPPV